MPPLREEIWWLAAETLVHAALRRILSRTFLRHRTGRIAYVITKHARRA